MKTERLTAFAVKCIIVQAICLVMLTSCNIQGVNSVDRKNQSGTEDQSAPTVRQVNITLEGGSGKATIDSPVTITEKDGRSYATLVWSSKNYDYCLVGGVRYDNENPGGMSTFTVPVDNFEEPFTFIADTTAMSKPHEIEYTIIWGDFADGETAGDPQNAENEEESESDLSDNVLFGKRDAALSEIFVDGSAPDEKEELLHAEGFDIFRYDDASVIRIYGVGDYLLLPADAPKIPKITDADRNDLVNITIIRKPVSRTYLVSTSAMDLVMALDALMNVRFSPLAAEEWHLEDVRRAIDENQMLYAGKYRAPDYELLIGEGCDLAVENTMIYHNPEVKEKLEELGIPVIVETSSYETDPLGRLEWIKLYGELFDKAGKAKDIYNEKIAALRPVLDSSGESRTVACFYVSATGMINVRIPGDYITRMIEMAGGVYLPDSAAGTSKTGMGTLNMHAEDFLLGAGDADILLYNKTIDADVESLDDLVSKDPLFSKLRAVKEGNVYAIEGDFFQNTMCMTDFITELHDIIGGNDTDHVFIKKLEWEK